MASRRVENVLAGDRVHADREVAGHPAQRLGGVQVAARQVERVTGPEHGVDDGWLLGPGRDGGAVVGPRLVAQRRVQHRLMDPPALLARHLQDEDVVHVVVRRETLRRRGSDVGVDLDRVAQVGGQCSGEVDERRPQPVQALQHDGVAVEEQLEHPVVGHLVADECTDAAGPGVAAGRRHDAVAGQPDEGRAQPTAGEQLVDRGQGEDVVVRRRRRARRVGTAAVRGTRRRGRTRPGRAAMQRRRAGREAVPPVPPATSGVRVQLRSQASRRRHRRHHRRRHHRHRRPRHRRHHRRHRRPRHHRRRHPPSAPPSAPPSLPVPAPPSAGPCSPGVVVMSSSSAMRVLHLFETWASGRTRESVLPDRQPGNQCRTAVTQPAARKPSRS